MARRKSNNPFVGLTRRQKKAGRRRNRRRASNRTVSLPFVSSGAKASAKAAGPQQSSVRGQNRNAMVKHSCSLVNPFCDAAFGARYPDGTGANTMPFTFHYTSSMTSSATENKLFGLLPDWNYGYFSSLSSSAGTFTIPSYTVHPTAIDPTSIAIQGRVVSAGFVVRVLSGPTVSAGMILVRSQTRLTPSDTPSSNIIPASADGKIIPAQPGQEASWVSKPCGPGAHAFAEAFNTTVTNGQCDWTIGTVELITGGNATTVIMVEAFVHVELMLKTNSSYSAFTKPATGSPRVVEAAGQLAGSIPPTTSTSTGNILEKFENLVIGKAEKVVDDIYTTATGWGSEALEWAMAL